MSYWDDCINRALMNYNDVINQVFMLDVRDCGDRCILRLIDWSTIYSIGNLYALMIDYDDFHELMKKPSIIRELFRRDLRRLILYPCFSNNDASILRRLGFLTINYITSEDCPYTEEVVMPPNAYDVVKAVNRGFRVYVHLYQPFIKRGQIPRNLIDDFFNYLRENSVKVNLIVERPLRS